MKNLYLLLLFSFFSTFNTQATEDKAAQRSAKPTGTNTGQHIQKLPEHSQAAPLAEDLRRDDDRVITKKEAKKELKQAARRRTVFLSILLVFIAILFPPLAVLLVDGLRPPFWLSILLTLLFYVPGLIYALFRIFKTR